jgi:hypothetical protein
LVSVAVDRRSVVVATGGAERSHYAPSAASFECESICKARMLTMSR